MELKHRVARGWRMADLRHREEALVAVRTEDLRVRVDRFGQVCVLTVCGEMDFRSAEMFTEFAHGAVAAMAPHPRRVVVDLSGLGFADCSGVRALAAVARSQPGRCSVVVRSARPAVRRVLDLLGVDLDLLGPNLDLMSLGLPRRGTADAAASSPTGELARQLRMAESESVRAISDSCRVAGNLAATEDRMAVTLRRLAAQRPTASDRLATLSQSAREQAVRLRDQARHALPR